MFSKLHDRMGTAGLIVAIVALVAALTGTAFAAVGLNSKQKNQVTAIAKKYAGKQGAIGGKGDPGAPGAAGINGTNGKDGTSGTDGAPGKSVALTTEPKGANCAEGGSKVEVEGNAASKKYVCNGKEGSPWTAGGTLPSGKSETGGWSFGATPTNANVALSFTIPLAAKLGANEVHYINAAGKEVVMNELEEISEPTSTACTGTAAAPTAQPGHLCVYTGFTSGGLITSQFIVSLENAGGPFAATGTSTAGARIFVANSAAATGWGTWAVTAAP